MLSLLEPGNPEFGSEPSKEAQLWGAVLMQAAYDFLGIGVTFQQLNPGHRELVADEAKDFFASDGEDPRGFVWICHCLDLEPEPIRKALFSRRAEIRGALKKRRTKELKGV